MQGQDQCRQGSDSSIPSSEAETAAPVLEPPRPDADSPRVEPARGDAEEEVFSTAEEVYSAPDSPHKEFHCAVLRALSREPVEAAKAEQAAGTAEEAGPCPENVASFRFLLLLLHLLPPLCSNLTCCDAGTPSPTPSPCLLCLLIFLGGFESADFFSPLPTHSLKE